MDKTVDFTKTVYELCKDNPEAMEVMKELGFEQITNPGMLNTVGRVMTIPKGAVMKGIDIQTIRKAFTDRGYIIKD